MSTLRRNLLPAHKATDIAKLTRRDITEAMDKLAAQGKLGAAADFRKHASTFLTWCTDTKGLIKFNPMHGYRAPALTRAQKLAKRSKRRALSDGEIKLVWDAASAFDTFGLLVPACLLTGARRSEPTYLRWSQHVQADAVLFDAATQKAGRDHFTPRGKLLNATLDAAKTYRGTNDFVFPSVATGGRMGGFSRRIAKLIEAAATLPWTMHDLRRTTRTILSKCGWDDQHQRVFVGQSAPDLDQRYNMDERAEVRRMMAADLDSYITAAISSKPTDIAVRQARAINPANKRRQELLTRLANLAAA
jgi:integrase